MGKVWVKARTILHAEENGKSKSYFPGDWCQVGRHQAREWLAAGQCEILKPAVLKTVQDLTDCTILLRGEINVQQRGLLEARFPGVPVEVYQGFPRAPGRFLLWHTAANLRQDLILTGFGLVVKWQLAAPLRGFDVLADKIGTHQEQAETRAIIHDLRVPVYDPRVLFVRTCPETRRLFAAWDGESELSFLRALYQSRPIVNALPPSWLM